MATVDDKKIIFSMVGVSKIIPQNRKQILKDIYLSFFYGAKIGIIGLNGAGKSTLMKIIAGLDQPTQGDVVWSPGYSVGYLPQDPPLDETKTVKENVMEGVQQAYDALKEYEEMLRQFPSEKEGEREALLLQAVTDVAGVQERLAQLYLKEILQYARKLWRQGIYIGDLIQEGNMSLLLALAEEMPEEGKADWMEERLLAGMESWVKEQTEQKYRDESMVEKVRKLEAAIRELSDDEEQKFSVEELAAYLDMDEEEIRAVLRLTSEGADEEK